MVYESCMGANEKVDSIKPYLISGGLVPLLKNRHGLMLSQVAVQDIQRLEEDYFNKFSSIVLEHGLPWTVKFFPSTQIESSLREIVESRRNGRPVITFDDVYCPEMADGIYNITRLMDPTNLGRGTFPGPRFGAPPLGEQVKKIINSYGRDIDIMDIGVFEGETLKKELESRFSSSGIRVHNAYVVFAGHQGIENLSKAGIKLHYAQALDWVDWMEIRDCIGFDGRKVGREHASADANNAFIPYSQNSLDWASIPSELGSSFKGLHGTFFDKIGKVLENEGYKLTLTPSRKYNQVHELRFT